MRTSIDLPDSLLERVRARTSQMNITFRSLVIAALEKELADETGNFQLREAAVGDPCDEAVSNETINRGLEMLRDFDYQP